MYLYPKFKCCVFLDLCSEAVLMSRFINCRTLFAYSLSLQDEKVNLLLQNSSPRCADESLWFFFPQYVQVTKESISFALSYCTITKGRDQLRKVNFGKWGLASPALRCQQWQGAPYSASDGKNCRSVAEKWSSETPGACETFIWTVACIVQKAKWQELFYSAYSPFLCQFHEVGRRGKQRHERGTGKIGLKKENEYKRADIADDQTVW